MSEAKTYTIIVGLLVGTFVRDWYTPLGHQDFLLYVLPVLLTAWLNWAGSAYVVATLATGFVAIGAVLSPPGIPLEVAAVNRSLSAGVFWMTAFLVVRGRAVVERRQASQLAAIVDSSADAMLSHDMNGVVTSWNAAAERLFGYAPAGILGQSVSRLMSPEHAEAEQRTLDRVRQGAAVARYQTTWMRRDGARLDLSVSHSPIRDQAGVVTGVSTVTHDISTLQKALELLREQDTRLNLVVSATHTGIWDWDLRTNRMYYSPLWKQSLGYQDDELSDSQDEWISRLHPDDRERAFALVKAFLAGKIPTYEFDHRLRHRDGGYRWIHTDAVLTRDERGTPIRMTGSHVDITQRRQEQEALRQSEERFRKYFEMGLIGMALTAPDKRWITVNDRLCQMLGYSRDELMAASWPSLTHPDDVEQNMDFFQRALNREIDGYQVEKRFIHKAGHVVHAVLSCSMIYKDDGALDYFVVLVHDITDQKRAEVSLRESEVTLQSFFDSASLMMGVVKVLADDIVHLSDNRATAEFFGTTPDAIRGRTARQLGVLPDILDLWVKRYHRCIANGTPVQFEYEHGGVDGKSDSGRILSATVACIGKGADGAARCSYVVEDVTKRRRDEALLRQAHESLERRVAERTSELVAATQRARILAQRVYEVQEDERRRLAQDLHDEIGQALTLLKLNLQQAQQAKAGPFPSAQLEECLAVSDQLLAQVRNLALDLRPSLLDDLGLVPAVRWYVSRQAERAGWELQLTLYDGPLALTPAQSTACFRVVQEAVTNIARHAGAKCVSVTVGVNDGRIEVAVHDDGVGFDVNHARRLAQQGYSMGLLGMEERISLVGGSLSIDSAAQRGTRIAFTISAGERYEAR